MTLLEAFLGSIQGLDVHPISTGKDPNLFFDEWHALAKCANGTGRMYLSWNVKMPRNELIIHGTRGILNVDCYLQNCILRKTLPGPKVVSLFWAAGTSSMSTLKGALATGIGFATGRVRPNPGIHNSVREFYRALTTGSAPPVTAQEGRSMIYWMEDVCRRTDAEKRARLAVSAPVPPGRILVTGAAGFVGKALVKRLIEQGERVRVLVHRPNPALETDPTIDVVYGDLGDPAAVDRAVAGVDLVYHVGATMRGSWPEFECGTVRGTQNVVDSCLRHSVKRLVYISSVTVLDYARMSPKDIVTENSSLEPHSERRGSYTQSKVAAERIVREAIRDRQLPAVILRPGQVFGSGAEKVPPFGTVAIGGRWLVIGSGHLRVPLVFIDDLVDGIVSAATKEGICGSTFQIVDGTEVTQRQYIDQTQVRHPVRVAYGPRILLYGVAILLEGLGKLLRRNVPLTRYKLRSITAPAAFDCSAAAQGLGWTPRIGAEQGLNATYCEPTPRTMAATAR